MASAAFQLVTIPPSREVAEQGLLPALREWFAGTIGAPTPAQRCAWPALHHGQHLLLSSPTGSGKTLAAFVPIFNELLRGPAQGLKCLYVAPLKALGRDVRANLKRAWHRLRATGHFQEKELRFGLRTGDTSQPVRKRQLSQPPSVLLTTPESLAQLLTQPAAREFFATLRWVIVDEIHALIGDKRGADLSLSLERLELLTANAPQRIGLSATCTPLPKVAEFLVGADRPCTIASVADRTTKHFAIEPLFEDLEYSPHWLATILGRLERELEANRTTLIFTNTRNLAERLTWALRRRFATRGDEIAVHHSALSAVRRRSVERRMKNGRLWVVVSSTSLELGIDIGTVDLVVFVHPPGAVVRLLQRVGRSGHRPNEPRRGLILTASPSELLEAAVTTGSGRDGQIEAVQLIDAPLDVLCQQLVGMAMAGLVEPVAMFDLVRRAGPFRSLTKDDFQDCLDYLSGRRRDGTSWLPARLSWEDGCFTIADARTAKLLRRNLGTILTEDACTIRLSPLSGEDSESKIIGEVDQIYADRLQLGDRFVLDGRCLELKKRRPADLFVEEVMGRPQAPRWLGAGVPMPNELARRIFLFRAQAGDMLRDGDDAFRGWLKDDYHLNDAAIDCLSRYFLLQETISEIPTPSALLVEQVSMQACSEYFVHTPLPRSANEAVARVLLHRWRREKRKDAFALAADLGIYVMTFEKAPLTSDVWRSSLATADFTRDFLDQLESGDFLQQQFARLAQTGLMLLRHPAGNKRKVGGRDWAERRLFDQVRAACPNFLLLRQARTEAVAACDVVAAQAFAESLASLHLSVRSLPMPSPFGESLLHDGFPTAPVGGDASADRRTATRAG